MLCGHKGYDYLCKMAVCFSSQILIEKKYIESTRAVLPMFQTAAYVNFSFLNL